MVGESLLSNLLYRATLSEAHDAPWSITDMFLEAALKLPRLKRPEKTSAFTQV
jgi:hypothetical protein